MRFLLNSKNEIRFRVRTRTEMMLVGNTLLLKITDGRLKLSPYDGLGERFLTSMWQGTSRSDLGRRFPDPEEQASVLGWYDALLDGGFLECLDLAHDIEPADLKRYNRLLHFLSPSETETTSRYDLLTRLRNARVGMIGTGGMGSWVIYNLLCCGVGHLRLIDGDVVEESNLNRSILYTEEDVGMAKVTAAARSIRRFAPRTEIETHDMFIDGEDRLVPLLAGLDLVIGTADKPPWQIRRWVAAAGRAVGIPTLQARGTQVGPFHIPAQGTSCGMCEWAALVERNPAFPGMLEAQSRLPDVDPCGISPVGSIAAGVVTMDVFRFLTGVGRLMTRDAVWELGPDFSAQIRPQPRHERCPVCSSDT